MRIDGGVGDGRMGDGGMIDRRLVFRVGGKVYGVYRGIVAEEILCDGCGGFLMYLGEAGGGVG